MATVAKQQRLRRLKRVSPDQGVSPLCDVNFRRVAAWVRKHCAGGSSCWSSCSRQPQKHQQQQQEALQRAPVGSQAIWRICLTPSTSWMACRTNSQRLYGRNLWDSRCQLHVSGAARRCACLFGALVKHEGCLCSMHTKDCEHRR